MEFKELIVEIQAKSEEMAYLCMEMGRTQAELENLKQEKIRRSEELGKLFDQLVKANKPTVEVIRDDLDTGKVMALRKAGWSIEKIAGEMNVSEYRIKKTLADLQAK